MPFVRNTEQELDDTSLSKTPRVRWIGLQESSIKVYQALSKRRCWSGCETSNPASRTHLMHNLCTIDEWKSKNTPTTDPNSTGDPSTRRRPVSRASQVFGRAPVEALVGHGQGLGDVRRVRRGLLARLSTEGWDPLNQRLASKKSHLLKPMSFGIAWNCRSWHILVAFSSLTLGAQSSLQLRAPWWLLDGHRT